MLIWAIGSGAGSVIGLTVGPNLGWTVGKKKHLKLDVKQKFVTGVVVGPVLGAAADCAYHPLIV